MIVNHSYDNKFMSYADQSSKIAANAVTKIITAKFNIHSVLDLGCAKGTWLDAWSDSGCSEIMGVDGDYVNQHELVISRNYFVTADLKSPLDFGRKFDLVQSLEVAEHLPHAAAEGFVDNLVRHSKGLILFSAAPPGQGGEFHINEQPYDYWRALFERHGYFAHDWIRPQIIGMRDVSFWYRYNTFLYAHKGMVLPDAVAATCVMPDKPLVDISPQLFRFRKLLVRLLPNGFRDGLARLKANLFPSGRW